MTKYITDVDQVITKWTGSVHPYVVDAWMKSISHAEWIKAETEALKAIVQAFENMGKEQK